MKIRKTDFSAACYNLISIIVALALTTYNYNIWIKCAFWEYIITIVGNFFFLYNRKRTIRSFPLVYYGLISLFHISQVYFAYIGYNSQYCIFSVLQLDSCKKGLTYAFVCIHVAYVFYYLFCGNENEKAEIKENNERLLIKTDEVLVKLFFYVFYILKFIIRIYLFYIGRTKGYIALLNTMNVVTSTIVVVSDVFSIVFLKEVCNQKTRKVWLSIIIITEVVFMFSGSRIQGITYILLLFLLVDYSDQNKNKERISNKIKLVVLVAFFVVFLPLISGSRFSKGNFFKFIGSGNLFQSIVEEFGMTILNTVVAIQNMNQINFLHGMSYYSGFVYVFPNIGDVFNEIENAIYYTNQLKPFYNYAYGGSNIGEAFVNFGYWGIMVFPFVGIAIAKIDELLRRIVKSSISCQLFLIMLVYQFILWTRSYFYQMIRLPIWIMFFYWLARQLFKQHRK